MTNADKFLSQFNEIEMWLKRNLGLLDMSFTEMIHNLRFKDSLIRNYYYDLYQFASLRNAIVHTRKMDRVIAEPYDETVAEIEKIKNELFNPPKVRNSVVLTIKPEQNINALLTIIKKNDYSQVPMVDEHGHLIEIITTNTVARWLSAKIEDDFISLSETSVDHLLPHIEYRNNYCFISQTSNLYEAANMFQSFASVNNRNPDALFITNSGRQNQRLTGIVCIEDVAGYYNRD